MTSARQWLKGAKQAISGLELEYCAAPSAFLTVSTGYAVCRGSQLDPDRLIAEANAALYGVKIRMRSGIEGYEILSPGP